MNVIVFVCSGACAANHHAIAVQFLICRFWVMARIANRRRLPDRYFEACRKAHRIADFVFDFTTRAARGALLCVTFAIFTLLNGKVKVGALLCLK